MIRQLYIDHNHITLLVTLLCMVSTLESLHCRPVPVCHIRLPQFAAAIKCRDFVSVIGYSTVPYFGPLGGFWYSFLTPSNYGYFRSKQADLANFENPKSKNWQNLKFVNSTFIIDKNGNKTSIQPILKSNSTSLMFKNNFCKMNIKKVIHVRRELENRPYFLLEV